MNRRSEEKPSGSEKLPIARAMHVLEEHVQEIVSVAVWGRKLGYSDPARFSRAFREYFHVRPQPVLLSYRALKIVELLRLNNHKVYTIAREWHLQNEQGIYQFIKRQTGCAPGAIGELSGREYEKLVKRLEKKIIE